MTATARTRSDETADETAAAAGAPDKGDEVAAADIRKTDGQDGAGAGHDRAEGHDGDTGPDAAGFTGADADEDGDADLLDEAPHARSSGVGTGAAAVVSTVLGFVALSGTWISDVAAERERVVGQLGMSQTAGPAEQITTMYGDPWHMTALVNGGFALLALVVAAVVLALPASGTSGTSGRPGWVRSFAWAGLALGVVGLFVSAGMYFDLFASMPAAPAAGTGQ
ncbi:hypothetical protein BGM19_26075 [Streptomyces agglomeratus]|uniref:Uncharacterized protein n=1 Tax=Streptomyces agglomeratus TaxID=285458 RepID=A0A1E5P5Q7_9ACTN|nr:hypothetical protein [Streptomyces agglomeratus]OEJ24886.1 hypothetical protein AS594_10740 [Streptomyces agglomeratus]OEJ53645.1 hypothetical protein BGK72_25475 [Streptomyces agglomeratus]OEJ60963.1 hypothetical protein BGM19_26075 [Streptomyces agglomeratus]